MISEMGGSITVDSQVNIGTRFTIHLPLTPPGATGGDACPLPLPQQPRVDAQRAEEKAT
jgi:hypothetical protein